MSQSECSACGLFFGVGVGYKNIRTTNGGLLLCDQCLGDINRKNPELIGALKANSLLMAGMESQAELMDAMKQENRRLKGEPTP